MFNPDMEAISYFSDLEQYQENITALEALQQMPNKPKIRTTPVAGETTDSNTNTSIIYKKDGKYYVYASVMQLADYAGSNSEEFIVWLATLSSADEVYFSIGGGDMTPFSLIPVITAIANCQAKKIFIVDHLLECAIFLAVMDEVTIKPTGAISFASGLTVDPNKYKIAWMPYLKSLYSKLVAKNLLTEEEVLNILDRNAIIFKTARELV